MKPIRPTVEQPSAGSRHRYRRTAGARRSEVQLSNFIHFLFLVCSQFSLSVRESRRRLQWQEAKDDTLAWYPGANFRKVRKVSIWRTVRFPGFLHVNSDRTNQPIRIYMWISLRWLPSLDRTFLGWGMIWGKCNEFQPQARSREEVGF